MFFQDFCIEYVNFYVCLFNCRRQIIILKYFILLSDDCRSSCPIFRYIDAVNLLRGGAPLFLFDYNCMH